MKSLLKIVVLTTMMLSANQVMAYSAIAVNDDVGDKAEDIGVGYGRGDTKEAAEADALKSCKSAGNKSCEVVITYDKCGAYANSKKYSGVGTGDTEDAAKQAAVDKCGSDACRVAASDCEQ